MIRSKRRYAVLAFALLLGAYLRFDGLSERSLRSDEAWSWKTSSQATAWEVVQAAQRDFNPPLYWLILQQWMACFGDSELALRTLSVVAGLFAVLFAFFLGEETEIDVGRPSSLGGCGLIFALLMATSSIHILWSQQVRMYSLATSLTILSSWLFLRAGRVNSQGAWIGYVTAAVSLTWVHNYGAMIVLSHFVYAVWAWWSSRLWLRSLLAGSLVFTLLSPWLIFATGAQVVNAKADYWIQPTDAWSLVEVVWHNCIPGTNDPSDMAMFVLFNLVGVLLLGVGFGKSGSRLGVTLFVVTHLLVFCISLMAMPLMFARYFQFAHVGLLLCMAHALACIKADWVRRMTLCGVVVTSVVWYRGITADFHRCSGVRGAVRFIQARGGVNDELFVTHPYLFLATCYYARHSHVKLVCRSTVAAYTGGSIIKDRDCVRPESIPTTARWFIGFESPPLPAAEVFRCREAAIAQQFGGWRRVKVYESRAVQ